MTPAQTQSKRQQAPDLTPEQEAAVLERARRRELDESMEAAGERQRAVCALLGDRGHAEGCPVLGDPSLGHRVEAFGATRPAIPDAGEQARPVTMVRCAECGHDKRIDVAYPDSVDQAVARLGDAGDEGSDQK